MLLILAGVSIATLTGENGILTRANNTKTETEKAKEDELRRLTSLEAATNTENTTHRDSSTGEEKTVTIPAGFAVSQVEGENTIEDGLVIIDSKGNEFVWVPVNNFNDFARHDFLNNINDNYFISTNLTESRYYEPKGNGITVDMSLSKHIQEAQKMYKSVKDNNGFYIGRYETGTASLRNENSTITDNIIIQKNAYAYNFIGWSNSNDMTNEQGGAVQVAKEFASKNNYLNVTSTLCYGVQWDAILRWMDSDNETSGYVTNPIGKGWYLNNYTIGNLEHKTGITIDNNSNCVKNIYDMAGNLAEWTIEAYSTDRRITRGGNYNMEASARPTAYRTICSPTEKKEIYGFRIALYIN